MTRVRSTEWWHVKGFILGAYKPLGLGMYAATNTKILSLHFQNITLYCVINGCLAISKGWAAAPPIYVSTSSLVPISVYLIIKDFFLSQTAVIYYTNKKFYQKKKIIKKFIKKCYKI